jgi:hypothetical protein
MKSLSALNSNSVRWWPLRKNKRNWEKIKYYENRHNYPSVFPSLTRFCSDHKIVTRAGAGDCRSSRWADEPAQPRRQREDARTRPAWVEAPTSGAGQALNTPLPSPAATWLLGNAAPGARRSSGHPPLRRSEEYLGPLSGFWWFNDTHLSS